MATKEIAPLTATRDMLEEQTVNWLKYMPQSMVGRFIQGVLTLLSDHPELQRCSKKSLLLACRRAAEDGLQLDGHEACIMPFRDGAEMLAQYNPMVFGIRKKVRGSGLVADWTVTAVLEGDEFDYALGDNAYIHHRPAERGGLKRKLRWVYSIATFTDGTKSRVVMNADEIEDIRSLSKARVGPWQNPLFYAEMAKAKCARRHAKQLPQSDDITAFWRRMDEDDGALPTPEKQHERIAAPPTSVGDALDQFAANPPLEIEHSSPENVVDRRAPADGGDAGSTARVPDAAEAIVAPALKAVEIDAVKKAYRRGQDDRKAGRSADDMPHEYADNEHNKEQVAWWSGFDGKPMPTFEQRR
jgi:recombination protein RecT